MRHPRLTETTIPPTRAKRQEPLLASDPIEAVQLGRLASAVLTKSSDDLAALAEANPMIVCEWIEAFRRKKIEAETDARRWSAAMAALKTATPRAVKTAAE